MIASLRTCSCFGSTSVDSPGAASCRLRRQKSPKHHITGGSAPGRLRFALLSILQMARLQRLLLCQLKQRKSDGRGGILRFVFAGAYYNVIASAVVAAVQARRLRPALNSRLITLFRGAKAAKLNLRTCKSFAQYATLANRMWANNSMEPSALSAAADGGR